MKTSHTRRGMILAVLAGVCLLPSVAFAATIVVGAGPDSSYLVLQSPNLGTLTYQVHYTYNLGSPQDGYFLLNQVLTSDPTLTVSLLNFGTPSSPNYIVDSFTYNSVTETNTPWPTPGPSWSHWVSGGAAGFPSASPVASGTWSFGSGISSPYRLISPGSWDALFYSDGVTLPGVSPVPEASSALLGCAGILIVFRRRRG